MRVSAKCDYACKALLELSFHWPSVSPLPLQHISEKQNIPTRYLVQILLQLKSDGLVNSARGKEGGYTLAQPPDKVKLGKVIRLMGGPLLPKANSASVSNSAFINIWNDVEKAMAKILDKITFKDICKKVKGGESAILYQI